MSKKREPMNQPVPSRTEIVRHDGWTFEVAAGEPLVRDVDLAERAGLAQPRDIRKLIEAHREELEVFGEICERVLRARSGTIRGIAQFRDVRESCLNEHQAANLLILMKTKAARELRGQMVRTFIAVRKGLVAPPGPLGPSLAPAQARIGDDPRACDSVRAWCRTASHSSGRTIQHIQGEIRKPWGTTSIYRVPLVALDHTLAMLQKITVGGAVAARLPPDRRQLGLFGSN